MDTCIFCRIAKGEIPAQIVHQDLSAVAFLDINPLEPGHALVIPRAHAPLLEDLAAEEAAALFGIVRRVAKAAREATGAAATTIAVNNGPAAGQEVPHCHVHVVPRRAGDGGGPVHALFRNRPKLPREEMDRIAAAFRAALGS